MADEGLAPAGVKFIAENADGFQKDLKSSADSVSVFEQAVTTASSGVNAAQEVFVGALRHVGEIALDAFSNAASAVVDFAKESFAGALEAEQGLARLQSTLESTGYAAGVTMDDAKELADQFKGLVEGSDDAVLAIEEMALRVGTISKEEMPDFIQRTADLAATMKVDGATAARTLARAYEDPLGVIGKLRVAGVLLTEDQEAQIKTMVEAGDTAGATALLMDQLAEATGGRAQTEAETLAGQWAIFNETIADSGEGIALSLLPHITALAQDILPVVANAVSEGATQIGYFFDALMRGDSEGVFETIYEGFDIISNAVPSASGAVHAAQEAFASVWDFVETNWPTIQETAATVFGSVEEVTRGVSNFVQDTLLPALAEIWGETGTNLPTVQQVFDAVMQGVSTAVQLGADFVLNVLLPALTDIVGWVVDNWPKIQNTVTTVMNIFEAVITGALSAVQSFWNEWGDEIKAGLEAFFDFWDTVFGAFSKAFEGDWKGFGEMMRDAFDQAVENLKTIASGTFTWFASQDWGQIGSDIIDGIALALRNGASALADAAIAAAAAAMEALKGFLGISSPSSLYADEIGDPSVEGIMQPFITRKNEMYDVAVDFVSAPMDAVSAAGSGSTSYTSSFTYSPTYYGSNQPTSDAQLMELFWSA